ncbi:MAG: NfeD family protein [Mangrovibacterium sp.]
MKNALNLLLILISLHTICFAQEDEQKETTIYQLNIKEEISPKVWRDTQHAFEEAEQTNAELILIHMNTYGGLVESADSIRTKILNSSIPVYVFIDNNAASAGALISIACDSIYMRKGASIGAATVVDQSGGKMPDKYQSYMRSTMRSTAESHGYDVVIENGDSSIVWHRNPLMAEAMVDERVIISGLVDSTQILTFTTSEAMQHGFCEGSAESINELLKKLNYTNYQIKEYKPSFIEKIIGFLINPFVSGILIMAIIGGIYYEMQTPGLGFPIIVALLAAVAYFAPLYLEGLAAHWEILLFLAGLILIALEIFVVPGFGITGISGITLTVGSLILSLIYNVDFNFNDVPASDITKATSIVLGAISLATIGCIYLSMKIFTSQKGPFSRLALHTVQHADEGYVGVDNSSKNLIGEIAISTSTLRPSGKISIDGKHYDAISSFGLIEKGMKVKIIKQEAAQLYVELFDDENSSLENN